MIYNLSLAEKRKLHPIDIFILGLIKQNRGKHEAIELENYEDRIKELDKLDLLFFVKTGNSIQERVRLSKKGNQWLDDLTTPDIEEQDITLFEWLKNIYLEAGKELGNQKKTKQHIAFFRIESGIEKNELAKLCQNFIKDDSFEYSQKLEYLFFKPSNVYERKFKIHSSRLYQYYLKQQG